MATVPSYATSYTKPVDLKKLDFIHAELERIGARRVLELGCGRGAILSSLVARGFDAQGVELMPDIVAEARTAGLPVSEGNALDWSDQSVYHAVIASEVIEHVLEPARLAVNARRHLEAGGSFIVTTPNGFGPWEMRGRRLSPRWYLQRSNFVRRRLGRKPYLWGDGRDHCQFFTLSSVVKEIESAGFELRVRSNSDFMSPRQPALARIDISIADHLPPRLVSGWYFVFRATDMRVGDRWE